MNRVRAFGRRLASYGVQLRRWIWSGPQRRDRAFAEESLEPMRRGSGKPRMKGNDPIILLVEDKRR